MKLPPLVLESKPIAVVDRMKTKQNPLATGSAVALYALLILLIAWLLHKKVQFAAPVKAMLVTDLSVPPQAPPKAGQDGWWWWTARADSGDEGNAAEVCGYADCAAE